MLYYKLNHFVTLEIPHANELPYFSPKFYDKFFRLIRADEIVALYTALLSEDKTILLVCEDTYDIVPIILTLFDLISPFEWCLPRIPFLVASNPDDADNQLFEMINNIQSIIIGIHKSSYNSIQQKMAEDAENMQSIIILDLTEVYPQNITLEDSILPTRESLSSEKSLKMSETSFVSSANTLN